MATCAMCGKSGLFLSLTERNMCKTCDAAHLVTINCNITILQESLELIKHSENIDTRISRCKDVIRCREKPTEQYVAKGIRLGDIDPAAMSKFASELIPLFEAEKAKNPS